MKAIKAGLGMVGALALTLIPTISAHADVQAQPGEIVGVGSDTVQYLADFIADGDYNGNAGYNATNKAARIVSYDATGDAFGTLTTGVGIVERAGQIPAVRPDGSGTGYDALNADTSGSIQFVRASSAPNTSRVNAANAAFGGYHAYRVTTDNVQIAVSGKATTEVPTGLTGSELATIYTAQPTTPGNLSTCPTFAAEIGRGPSSVAHPIIPQTGSGTRNSFLAAINVTTPGACVATGQEHDPSLIQNDADALGPFSAGRVYLINQGYFAAHGVTSGAVVLQSGTFPSARPLYIVLRQNDLTDSGSGATIGVPNATTIADLFATGTGAFTKSAATRLYASAGYTKSFADCEANGQPVNTFC